MADDISSLIIDGSEYTLIDSTAVHNVDSALSSSSTNPVQNKVVKAAVDGKEDIIDIGTISATGGNDTYIITSIPAAGQTLLASLAAPCDVAFTATIDSQSLYFVGSYNGDETVNNVTYKVVSGTIKNGFSGAKTFVAAFNNSGSGTLNLLSYGGSSSDTTYTFTGGTQSFTATPSSGTAQTVNIKPQIFKGTCSTAASTTAKTVTCPEFTSADLVTGAVIFVTFTATNNGAVGSLTLNVNGTGAKSIKYMRNAAESNLPAVGYLRANMTYRFVYNNSSWVCDTDYDSGDALAYRIRHNSSTLPVSGATYQYRILFTSADGEKYVPSNTSSSTDATSKRAVNQTPIDPFGEILYYSSSTAISSGSNPGASSLWSQYAVTLGYSFNRTGVALVLTYPSPIYIKCAPQADGSAIIDADNPYVQALPSTADGKIYIFLGIAYSATAVEMLKDHPVYYYKTGVGVIPWPGVKYAADFDVLPISRGGTQATSFTSDKVIYYSGVGLASSGTDYSKLQYLDNVNSDIQNQIDGKAASTHTHGDVGANGTLTTNPAIAADDNDAIVIADFTLDGAIKKSSITFDTSNTSDYLRKDGTWATPPGGSSSHPIFKGYSVTNSGGDTKVVTCPEFTLADLVIGATILVKFNNTNSEAATALGLNVNSTGTYPIRMLSNGKTKLLSANNYLVANETYLFTFDGTYWVTTIDNNQVEMSSIGMGFVNAMTTYRYKLMFQLPKDYTTASEQKALFAIHQTSTGYSNYSKSFRTQAFDPFGVIAYYRLDTTVADGTAITNYEDFYTSGNITIDYAFNINRSGTVGTECLAPNLPVYLKAKYNAADQTANFWQDLNSNSYLDRSGLVQSLPTTNPNTANDFYIYIYLGQAYTYSDGTNRMMYLSANHPVYAWNSSLGTMTLFTGEEVAPLTHTHGDIGANGTLTTNPAIAADTGDAIVITDSGIGNAIKKSSITFDTTDTSNFLRKDGTWAVPAGGGGGGSIDEIPFLICSTAASTVAKTVDYSGFTLANNKRVYVQFTKGNTANLPTLNVNGTGAYQILYMSQGLRNNVRDYYNGNNIPENVTIEFVYYNQYWRIVNGWPSGIFALNGSGSRLSNGNRSCSVPKLEYFLATSTMTTGKPTAGDAKVLQMNWDNNYIYASQLACGLNNSTHSSLDRGWVQYRCQNGALDTWTDWMDLAIVRTGTMTITDNDATSPSSDTWNYMKIGQQVTVWGSYTATATSLPTTLSGLRYNPLFSSVEHSVFDYKSMGLKMGSITADVTLTASSTSFGVAGYLMTYPSLSYATGTWLSIAKSSDAVIKFTYLTND